MAHDGLLGTLLGFGRNNAFLFYVESHLETANETNVFVSIIILNPCGVKKNLVYLGIEQMVCVRSIFPVFLQIPLL